MGEVTCDDCGTVLGRHNPFFVVLEDQERRCVPCRQAAWVPGKAPSKPVRFPATARERPSIISHGDAEFARNALAPQFCECDSPIPPGDPDDDTCIRCAKHIAPRLAVAA